MKSLSRSFVGVFAIGILVGTIATTGVDAAIRGSAKFVDVPNGAFYDDAVGELSDVGIIRGVDATHFAPNKPVTRGEVAILLKRLRDDMRGISQVPAVPQPLLSSSSAAPTIRSSSSKSSSSSSSSSRSSVASSSSSSAAPVIPSNAAGGIRFTTPYFTVDKNGGTMKVTVVRIGANQGSVTVDYSMSGGTAIAGKDFTPSSGTLTFAGKETSKVIQIPIFNNSAAVGNPVINILLSRVTGGANLLDPSKASVTIINSSASSSSSSAVAGPVVPVNPVGTFQFSASQYGAMENIPTLTVTVVRLGGSNGIANVNYASADGMAHSGVDYTGVTGSLSFASGETSKTFTIQIANNTATDGNRKFTIALSSPTGGASLGDIKSADVSIIDDEIAQIGSGSYRFSATSFTVSRQTQNYGIVYVTRINSVAPSTVTVATNGGSALPGSDYDVTSAVISFAQGEITKPFFVPIHNSTTVGSRGVSVYLSAATNGAAITDPTICQLTIQ